MCQYMNFRNITALSLEKYLLFNNWIKEYDFPNKNLMVFRYDEEMIVVPSSENFVDFYDSLPNIIDLLSVIYGKADREIIKEITTSYHDLLEFRIKSDFSQNGELPLDYATECIDGIKELILYSACAEQTKKPVCFRTTNNAKELLSNFKLAQTEVGSFIINIDIQVANEEEQYVLPEIEMDDTLEHKVVQRIGKAIRQVDDIAHNRSAFDEIVHNAYESGITANMCEALLKLKPNSPGSEIETKIRYASACSNGFVGNVEVVKMQETHFSTMNAISKRYREFNSEEMMEVEGYITSLNTKRINEVRSERVIHIAALVNGEMRSIKAELGDNDYREACDAHRDMNKVAVYGNLDMSTKMYKFLTVERYRTIHE